MTKELLEVKNLKKFFPIREGLFRRQVGNVKAVDNVSFSINKGEVLGIVGESGCGKSTLARASIRLIEPTEGEILFNGHNMRTLSKKELKNLRKDIQIVFQDPYASLNPRKMILDCIGEGLLYHGIVKTKKQQINKVEEILHSVGLPADAWQRYPHEFSGGQQQRICIGRAIAPSPKLIICDEAVSALDVSVQAQILNLLNSLKKEYDLSYMFISHDLSIVRHICDRVIVLYLGKVMESASTEELFSNPKHPYTQALLAAIPPNHPKDRKKILPLRGDPPSVAHPPSGCPFRTRCPYAQPICADPPPEKILFDSENQKNNHTYYCILD